ncbi:MAG: methylated-DNA--[protein]-cysteine S-methyltransferase [Chitinophagaceae bacterium]|jgi:methylated-DNA-[protein]-cysteine S-methyltransferase|nr:methylated-DNA--[protein]-cysteine S-methyltransferase [Chitinophagaceae bacterium]
MNTFGQMIMHSPLGKLLITDEDDYISEIRFLEDGDQFPQEQPTHLTLEAVRQLNEYFEGNRNAFEFPVHQDGTVFQQKVWQELLNIPFGKTISYLELARRLGDEKTIRAAASANGKNKLAIVVPCHRVIGIHGKLVGYAGGLWRKKWLLEHEKAISGQPKQGSLFF